MCSLKLGKKKLFVLFGLMHLHLLFELFFFYLWERFIVWRMEKKKKKSKDSGGFFNFLYYDCCCCCCSASYTQILSVVLFLWLTLYVYEDECGSVLSCFHYPLYREIKSTIVVKFLSNNSSNKCGNWYILIFFHESAGSGLVTGTYREYIICWLCV